MKPINKLLVPAIGTVFSLMSANAAIIFDASTSNAGIVGNAVNLTSNSFSGTTGALTVTTTASGNNNATGLASNDDIDTLKGSALVATDVVTMKLTVAGTTGGGRNLRANGIEFGMSPNGTDFRPLENLLFQIDADNDDSGMAIGNLHDPDVTLNAAGWAATESSLLNGYTVTLVADSAGYTFTLSDITEVGNLTNTTLSYSNTFTGSQFVDNFGGGHIYYTHQVTSGTSTVEVSEFSIDVVSVPEPSSTALIGLSGLALLLRRRR